MKQKEKMLAELARLIGNGVDVEEIRDNFAASCGAFAQAKQIGGDLFIVAYSPEMEGYEVADSFVANYICVHETYRYHSHSEWYYQLLRSIAALGSELPLFAPEFEFVRKNGSKIESVSVLSNYVDATEDATVFVELNVLPHLLRGATKPNHPFAVLVKALQETRLTTNAGCGMHVHFSTAAAARTLEPVYDRLAKMRYASESAPAAAAQFALWNRSKYYNGATLQGIKSGIDYARNEAAKNIETTKVVINDLPLSAKRKYETINRITAAAAKNAIDKMREGGHSEVYHKTKYETFEFRCAKCTSVQSEYLTVLKNILAFLGLRPLTCSERKNNSKRLAMAYEARELANETPVWDDLFLLTDY